MLVNTCGFIETAKKDSVDALLAAADLKDNGRTRAVVAVGCMAERYGAELAEAMPEADAVLGFDAYADMAGRLRSILAGERPEAHAPRDRRRLLPLAPVERPAAVGALAVPGHGPASGPRPLRHRLADGATAPLKIASGCDRRCTFCAIPRFRGAYLSRPLADVVAEARWLVAEGVREVFLVSENTTSYGKDVGDLRLLEQLLTELSTIDGLDWIRVSYLQPAEMRPEPGGRDDRDGEGCAVLRPVLPARRTGGAAPDAAVRGPGRLPGPGRADPRGGAARRDPVQRHLRLPR